MDRLGDRCAFVRDQGKRFQLGAMCRALDVSISGYYAWRKRSPSRRSREDRALTVKIRAIHQASRKSYVSPRVYRQLRQSVRRARLPEVLGESRYPSQHEPPGQLPGQCCDRELFHTLKAEAIHGVRFQTQDQARRELFDYIGRFYNPRGHPAEFERRAKEESRVSIEPENQPRYAFR